MPAPSIRRIIPRARFIKSNGDHVIKAASGIWLITRSLAIGLLGASAALAVDSPLPWMLGPLLITIVVSLLGVRGTIPGGMSKLFKGVVGVMLGTAITTDTLHRITDWPISIAMVAIGLLSVAGLVSLYYMRVGGFDRLTAVAASLPGSISSITPIAIGMGANAQQVILPQLLRIFLVVLCVPPIYLAWQGAPEIGTGPAALTEPALWLGQGLWVGLFAPAGWYVARRLRLPVPQVIGPMLVTAAFTLGGVEVQLPAWLFAVTFLVLGTSIGTKFHKMPLRELFGTGRHAVGGTVLGFVGIAAVGVLIHLVAGVPLPVAMLAVTPGGIAEMALLATALGVDPVFVTFHQVIRSVLLNLVAPAVFAWARGPSRA